MKPAQTAFDLEAKLKRAGKKQFGAIVRSISQEHELGEVDPSAILRDPAFVKAVVARYRGPGSPTMHDLLHPSKGGHHDFFKSQLEAAIRRLQT